MSHWVNDRIADDAIDTVANMSDFDVLNDLAKRGIASPISGSIVADPQKAADFMDAKRDQLIDLVFDDLMGRPGPCG